MWFISFLIQIYPHNPPPPYIVNIRIPSFIKNKEQGGGEFLKDIQQSDGTKTVLHGKHFISRRFSIYEVFHFLEKKKNQSSIFFFFKLYIVSSCLITIDIQNLITNIQMAIKSILCSKFFQLLMTRFFSNSMFEKKCSN